MEVTTLMPQLSKTATDAILKDVRRVSTQFGVEMGDALEASYQAISAGNRPRRTWQVPRRRHQTEQGGDNRDGHQRRHSDIGAQRLRGWKPTKRPTSPTN